VYCQCQRMPVSAYMANRLNLMFSVRAVAEWQNDTVQQPSASCGMCWYSSNCGPHRAIHPFTEAWNGTN
jgi:hypothetical protein